MSGTVDLTMLSGLIQGLDREMRLPRLQVDQLAGVLHQITGGVPPRLSAIEQLAMLSNFGPGVLANIGPPSRP